MVSVYINLPEFFFRFLDLDPVDFCLLSCARQSPRSFQLVSGPFQHTRPLPAGSSKGICIQFQGHQPLQNAVYRCLWMLKKHRVRKWVSDPKSRAHVLQKNSQRLASRSCSTFSLLTTKNVPSGQRTTGTCEIQSRSGRGKSWSTKCPLHLFLRNVWNSNFLVLYRHTWMQDEPVEYDHCP